MSQYVQYLNCCTFMSQLTEGLQFTKGCTRSRIHWSAKLTLYWHVKSQASAAVFLNTCLYQTVEKQLACALNNHWFKAQTRASCLHMSWCDIPILFSSRYVSLVNRVNIYTSRNTNAPSKEFKNIPFIGSIFPYIFYFKMHCRQWKPFSFVASYLNSATETDNSVFWTDSDTEEDISVHLQIRTCSKVYLDK